MRTRLGVNILRRRRAHNGFLLKRVVVVHFELLTTDGVTNFCSIEYSLFLESFDAAFIYAVSFKMPNILNGGFSFVFAYC